MAEGAERPEAVHMGSKSPDMSLSSRSSSAFARREFDCCNDAAIGSRTEIELASV